MMKGRIRTARCGLYVQSERQAAGIYGLCKKLIDKGEAYYCFCDEGGGFPA